MYEYHPGICLEELTATSKIISQDIVSVGQDMYLELPLTQIRNGDQ
jgi:hypothetical protein